MLLLNKVEIIVAKDEIAHYEWKRMYLGIYVLLMLINQFSYKDHFWSQSAADEALQHC